MHSLPVAQSISVAPVTPEDWEIIGDKASLSDGIANITGIDKEYLQGKSLEAASISMRMSWAAERNATRVEDIAYSLLGIFDVNMPLLYGEGKNAFIRLQHEIIKKSNDQSIFAWRGSENIDDSDGPEIFEWPDETDDGHQGLLARSPTQFRYSGNIERIFSDTPTNPYSITNQGLSIELPVDQVEEDSDLFAFLNCRDIGELEPITT